MKRWEEGYSIQRYTNAAEEVDGNLKGNLGEKELSPFE
jgi:hypothetical protein